MTSKTTLCWQDKEARHIIGLFRLFRFSTLNLKPTSILALNIKPSTLILKKMVNG